MFLLKDGALFQKGAKILVALASRTLCNSNSHRTLAELILCFNLLSRVVIPIWSSVSRWFQRREADCLRRMRGHVVAFPCLQHPALHLGRRMEGLEGEVAHCPEAILEFWDPWGLRRRVSWCRRQWPWLRLACPNGPVYAGTRGLVRALVESGSRSNGLQPGTVINRWVSQVVQVRWLPPG